MCSFGGRLRQLIDPSLHDESHISLIDGVGQEYCIECSVNDLCSESTAVLHKTHVCSCLDQIVAAGIEVDRLCNILLPAIVNCVANLKDTDSPPIFKLKQSLINLAESIQIHLSASEVNCFISILVDTVTSNGCSQQPHLISLLGRTARAAHRHREPNLFIQTLCSKYSSFMERLIRSSLVSMIPDLVCDVLFIFSLAASEPIMKNVHSSSFEDSVSSSSQSMFDSQQHGKRSQRDHLKSISLTPPEIIFRTTYQVVDVLVGTMEKLGHEGCWTNFLALLSHLSVGVETGLLLDDQGFFDNLVHGQSNVPGKTNKSNAMQQMRLGVCARAQLVQTSSPASLCAAARVFSSLSRQNNAFARQLLRDGVGEFAIAGLNTQGLASGPSIKEALSELLNDISSKEPIAFFHPSHFHPFALEAVLEVLGLKENTTVNHQTKREERGKHDSSTDWDNNFQYTSEHGADSLRFTGPLASVLLRCSQHSSIIDNVGVGSAIDAVSRAALANLAAGVEAESSLTHCLNSLIGLMKLKGGGGGGVGGEGLLSLVLSTIFSSDMVMHEPLTMSSLQLASLWLHTQKVETPLHCAVDDDDDAHLPSCDSDEVGGSWVAELILGQHSQFIWNSQHVIAERWFPQFSALIADLVAEYPYSLKNNEAFSLAEYICDGGFLTSSLSALVLLQTRQGNQSRGGGTIESNHQDQADGISFEDIEAMIVRGFAAAAGRLVGFKFPITDGLMALAEELILLHNERNSYESLLLHIISNFTVLSEKHSKQSRGACGSTMEVDAFEDTFEAFEVALLVLSHSPVSKFHNETIAYSVRDYFVRRFSPSHNKLSLMSSYRPTVSDSVDWPGLRGGVHALHLTAQLGTVEASVVLSAASVHSGFIDRLSACIDNGDQCEPLISAMSLGLGIIPLMELEPSPQVDSIIFHVALSGFERCCESININRSPITSVITLEEHCDTLLAALGDVTSISASILKEDSYWCRLRLLDALVGHLTSNFRRLTVDKVGDIITLLEILISQQALIAHGNTEAGFEEELDVGPLNSIHRVSSLHEFVAFASRDMPSTAVVAVRLFSKLLIHAIASLTAPMISPPLCMPPPPPASTVKQHVHQVHPKMEEMLPLFGRCTPMLALSCEVKDGNTFSSQSVSSQVSSIAALTWIAYAAIQSNDVKFVNTLCRAHGDQIAALMTRTPSSESSSEVRAAASAFILTLSCGLKGVSYSLPLPPPLLSASQLLTVIDPLSQDIQVDETDSCSNAVIAICFHIASRYIYTNTAVHHIKTSKHGSHDSSRVNFESFDLNGQPPSPLSGTVNAWWAIGSRRLTRLVNAAYHHSLSSVQVVQDAAIAFLIVLTQCHPELCWNSSWHSVVTQEILTAFTESIKTSQHGTVGVFDLLFLSITLRHEAGWVKDIFAPIINSPPDELLSHSDNSPMMKYFTSVLQKANPLWKGPDIYMKGQVPGVHTTKHNDRDCSSTFSKHLLWISLGTHLQIPTELDWAMGLWDQDIETGGDKKGLFHPKQIKFMQIGC